MSSELDGGTLALDELTDGQGTRGREEWKEGGRERESEMKLIII